MRKYNLKNKRDYLLKKKYLSYEPLKLFNNSVYNEFQLLNSFTYTFYKRYYKNSTNYFSKARFRCLFTGRTRGTLSFFMMSRMVFKKFALNGWLIGVKKASW